MSLSDHVMARMPDERFRTFFEDFRTFYLDYRTLLKIAEDDRRRPEDVSIMHQLIVVKRSKDDSSQ